MTHHSDCRLQPILLQESLSGVRASGPSTARCQYWREIVVSLVAASNSGSDAHGLAMARDTYSTRNRPFATDWLWPTAEVAESRPISAMSFARCSIFARLAVDAPLAIATIAARCRRSRSRLAWFQRIHGRPRR